MSTLKQFMQTTDPRLNPIKVIALLSLKFDFSRKAARISPEIRAWSYANTNCLAPVSKTFNAFSTCLKPEVTESFEKTPPP